MRNGFKITAVFPEKNIRLSNELSTIRFTIITALDTSTKLFYVDPR